MTLYLLMYVIDVIDTTKNSKPIDNIYKYRKVFHIYETYKIFTFYNNELDITCMDDDMQKL